MFYKKTEKDLKNAQKTTFLKNFFHFPIQYTFFIKTHLKSGDN